MTEPNYSRQAIAGLHKLEIDGWSPFGPGGPTLEDAKIVLETAVSLCSFAEAAMEAADQYPSSRLHDQRHVLTARTFKAAAMLVAIGIAYVGACDK